MYVFRRKFNRTAKQMELNPTGQEETLDSFYAGGAKTSREVFSPVCVRSHWDPTQMTRHILPQLPAGPQTTDPRQEMKLCTTYHSTSVGDAPLPDAVYALPDVGPTPAALLGSAAYIRPQENIPSVAAPGGAAGRGAPYALYAQNVNAESDIYRLDERLTRCKEYRYAPPTGIPTDATNVLPSVSQEFEMAAHATYVGKTAGCREHDDDAAWNRSARLFFNQTRMDRVWPAVNGPLACSQTVE